MTAMSMVQALNSAIDVMLERDPKVLIFGEDVGFYGGVFRVTEGLQKKHGERRVFDTPIAEGAMLGAAVGMGAYGLRPIVEIQFADYIYPATDQLVSEDTARPASSSRRSPCARRAAAGFSAARRTAKASRRSLPMSAASRPSCRQTRTMPRAS